MEETLIAMGISVVLQTLKNAKNKAKFKAAFLKIRNAINLAFAGDDDFK